MHRPSGILLACALAGTGPVLYPGGGAATAASSAGFDLSRPETVASGLEVPWGLAFLPDGSALVSERDSARVLKLRPGTSPQTVATLSGVARGGEGGLLGLAVQPVVASGDVVTPGEDPGTVGDPWLYGYLTTATDNRVVRFRLGSPQQQQVVLSGLARASFHNGGRIAFGPDGMLYVAVGDAGTPTVAQDQGSQNGKILRMRPDGGIPTDNPFPGSRVYSLGHRNVQGLAWDPAGRLWASEFGQNTWDEINLIVPGGNYGWPTVEGRGGDPRFRDPLVVWSTAEASPSGVAQAGGTLYVAALRGQRLWTVPLIGDTVGTPVAELQQSLGRLRTVAVSPDGWLWIATSNRDGRGSPVASDDRVLRFPPVTSASAPTTVSSSPIGALADVVAIGAVLAGTAALGTALTGT